LSPIAVYVRRRGENPLQRRDSMKYLFQIYPAASADEFEGLSEDEQEAIVGEYLALERGSVERSARARFPRFGGRNSGGGGI
jgi:hypothetical protein